MILQQLVLAERLLHQQEQLDMPVATELMVVQQILVVAAAVQEMVVQEEMHLV
jgi:hypothetical protein